MNFFLLSLKFQNLFGVQATLENIFLDWKATLNNTGSLACCFLSWWWEVLYSLGYLSGSRIKTKLAEWLVRCFSFAFHHLIRMIDIQGISGICIFRIIGFVLHVSLFINLWLETSLIFRLQTSASSSLSWYSQVVNAIFVCSYQLFFLSAYVTF